MKFMKERKVYLILAGAGVIALGIDRLFLGSAASGPSTASAVVASLSVPRPLSDGELWSQEVLALESSLAQQLRRIAEEHEHFSGADRDAFHPSAAWLGDRQDEDQARLVQQPEAERFRQEHQLMAVVPNDRCGYAMVDGTPLFVGHKLEGFTLVAVRDRSAIFKSKDTYVDLRMDQVSAALRSQKAQ